MWGRGIGHVMGNTDKSEPASSGAAGEFDSAALMRVLDVARELARPMELPQLLHRVIEAGCDVIGADRGAVFLYDETTRELYTEVALGEGEIRISIDTGIAGACARERAVVNVQDCYADERFNQAIDKKTGYRTRCILALPLIGLDDQLVGVVQLLNSRKPCFDASDERLGEIVSAQAATAIQRAVLLEEREVRIKMERDLDLAREIQSNVLPKSMPVVPGYDFAGFNRPADQTGGDIYDVRRGHPARRRFGDAAANQSEGEIVGAGDQSEGPPDDTVFLLLADATGHGIGPALSVTQFLAMMRVGTTVASASERLLVEANNQLCEDLPDNRFITAFLGILRPDLHVIDYQSAGQGPLLHFHAAEKRFEWLNATTLPLGIMPDPEMDDVDPMRMAPGDLVVLLTDGFYEYANHSGTMFETAGVEKSLLRTQGQSAVAILDGLLADLQVFAGGAPQNDDLTAIIVKRDD